MVNAGRRRARVGDDGVALLVCELHGEIRIDGGLAGVGGGSR